MKNLLYLILVVFYLQANAQVKHKIVITLDTKKMENPDCSLGADGSGGAATVTEVYMHSGICTCKLNETTLARECGTAAENRTYCQAQIKDYLSNVWQHVVGNWGSDPKDDGVGKMTNIGNGVYSIEFIIEDYYSDPALVNTSSNTGNSAVPSTPMPAGSVAYVMGLVFRDGAGDVARTGRDIECKDIFIVDLDTDNPTALNGSLPDYDNPYLPLTSITMAVEEIENFSRIGAFPNPMKDGTSIEYLINQSSKNISIKIYNTIGQEVRDLFNGYKTQGSQKIFWNGKDNNGFDVPSGAYYYLISDNDKTISSERLVVIR
ncbi:MAG: hypothetical protein A2046_11230 [Bacteroidetes bacterium GWA2_30_7]|nr:MAG: hypothetical protein A2046_11230 [Bacteroidetes bacterium GWA2_30_7]